MLLTYSGRAISFGLALSLILMSVVMSVFSVDERRWLRRAATLTAILAALSLELTIGSATLMGDYRLLSLTLVTGLSACGLGIVLSLIERRHTKGKRGLPIGVLIIGIGLLGSISSLIVPVIPSQLAPLEAPTPTPPGNAAATPTLVPTRTPRVSATATVPPTLTFRPSALPSLTETPPRPIPTLFSTAISTQFSLTADSANGAITETASAICSVTVNQNVNLRAAPNADSQLLTTIPFGKTLAAFAQIQGWWHVRYEGRDGWVTKDATTGAPGCATLPTQTP